MEGDESLPRVLYRVRFRDFHLILLTLTMGLLNLRVKRSNKTKTFELNVYIMMMYDMHYDVTFRLNKWGVSDDVTKTGLYSPIFSITLFQISYKTILVLR